jgi:hypothetical protein
LAARPDGKVGCAVTGSPTNRTTSQVRDDRDLLGAADPVLAIRHYGYEREWPLVTSLVIGRAEGCTIRFVEQFISSQHAVIEQHAGAAVVRDLQSRNGVYVNRKPVDAVSRVSPLRTADVIDVGDLRGTTRLLTVGRVQQVFRSLLWPLVGWGPESCAAIDATLVASAKLRDLVIVSELGRVPWRIARLAHEHGPQPDKPLIVEVEPPTGIAEERDLLDRAEHGTLAVPLAAVRPGSLLEAELRSQTRDMRVILVASGLEEAASVLKLDRVKEAPLAAVPPLAARPNDAVHLVPILIAEHRASFPRAELSRDDVMTLQRLPWPTVDALSTAVEYISAIRAEGSLRGAEKALGVAKSALQRWLVLFEAGDPAAVKLPESSRRR